MNVIEITEYGKPEVLQLRERPRLTEPAAGSGLVLIEVHAAGINRPDVLQRQGLYAPPPGTTDIPGLEIAGVIVGGDLTHPSNQLHGFQVGDHVCALVAGGGYAELCYAPLGQCLPIPTNLSMVEAASLPETVFTVWSNLFKFGGLTVPSDPSHRKKLVLVHGGSSGIGVTAIQLATLFGHEVIVTVGSEDKRLACLNLGASCAINYKSQDFVQEVMQYTNNRGVDLVLDMVGGNYIARDVLCAAEEGRIVCIAVQGGKIADGVDVSLIMRKRLVITGSTLRPRPISFKELIAAEVKTHVWPLLMGKKFSPVIFRTFPSDQASKAHELMESNQHVGKIVLTLKSEEINVT